MSKHVFAVLTNAKPGRDDEFNRWYDEEHIPDVLKVPGIVAAQRFTLSPSQRMDPPYPFKYFALYEIDTEDLAQTMRVLRERIGTDAMPVSDALDPSRSSWVFHEISPRFTREG